MKRLFAIPCVFALAACDAGPPPQAEARQPNPVFETQIQALEKARAVEGQVMDAAQAQQRQIDDAAQ